MRRTLRRLRHRWFPETLDAPEGFRRVRAIPPINLLDPNKSLQRSNWCYLPGSGERFMPKRRVSPTHHRPHVRIGEILISKSLVTPGQLEEALVRQRSRGTRLGQILVSMGALTENSLVEALGEQLGIASLELENFIIDPAIAKLVPEHIAQRHGLIPIGKSEMTLHVAMVDPLNVLAIDDVYLMTGLRVVPFIAGPAAVGAALKEMYDAANRISDMFDDLDFHLEHTDSDPFVYRDEDMDSLDENAGPIIKLVNLILNQAVHRGATEIALEPYEKEFRVRYRRNGVFELEMTPPRKAQEAILNRIRVMANIRGLKLDSGTFCHRVQCRRIYYHVETFNTVHGMSITLKIRDEQRVPHDLTELGMAPVIQDKLEQILEGSPGLHLVVGARHSGRTTLRYRMLKHFLSEKYNLVSLERRFLSRSLGINQIHCKKWNHGLIDRHISDIDRRGCHMVQIDEVDNPETIRSIAKLANSGTRVVTTVPGQDFMGALHHIKAAGVDLSYLFRVLRSVTVTGLIPSACEFCHDLVQLSPFAAEKLGLDPEVLITLGFQPNFGENASRNGERIRVLHADHTHSRLLCEKPHTFTGVYSVIPITRSIRQSILLGTPDDQILEQAIAAGMVPFSQQAKAHVLRCRVSIETLPNPMKQQTTG